jgi:hypothetical protein
MRSIKPCSSCACTALQCLLLLAICMISSPHSLVLCLTSYSLARSRSIRVKPSAQTCAPRPAPPRAPTRPRPHPGHGARVTPRRHFCPAPIRRPASSRIHPPSKTSQSPSPSLAVRWPGRAATAARPGPARSRRLPSAWPGPARSPLRRCSPSLRLPPPQAAQALASIQGLLARAASRRRAPSAGRRRRRAAVRRVGRSARKCSILRRPRRASPVRHHEPPPPPPPPPPPSAREIVHPLLRRGAGKPARVDHFQ